MPMNETSVRSPHDNLRSARKTWGMNHEIHRDADLHVARIHVQRGGYCSRHYHKAKDNAFLVVQGRLMIIRYQPDGQVRTTLTPEMGIRSIPAEVEHRFLALDDETIAYELYYRQSGVPLNLDDIVRRDQGGILPHERIDREEDLK